MADAYGKLTGRPGIAVVTRGPGATHASVGVHTAFQDSTPMILLVGQVASDQVEREAFQEVDFRRMFGPLTKWVAQIDRADRIPEYVARAFATACAGRPGPVVLALPEDMLAGETDAPDAKPFHVVQPHPGADADRRAADELLEHAERPLAIIGGGGWTPRAARDMRTFLEANALPAGAAFRRQDAIDNDSPSYVGDVGIGINPKLAERVREADLLLVVGPRLGEMTTSGYTLVEPPTPRRRSSTCTPAPRSSAASTAPSCRSSPGWSSSRPQCATCASSRAGSDWTAAARADYEAWQQPGPMPGTLDLGECIAQLRERVPDAIVTNGAGNFSAWVHRFWRWHEYPTQLAPTSGAMGYGVPAAVAAKVVHPERTVICFAGDGDFLMSGQELATAAQYDLPIVVLVVNNGMYGTIRMHQERHYPGRVVGTDLANPDFAAFARAFGAHGETVTETAEFADALERALASGTLGAASSCRSTRTRSTRGRRSAKIRADALK